MQRKTKKEMNRDQAFQKMIEQRGVHHQLGISSTAVRTLRNRLKADGVSATKKKEMLQAYGAKLKQEEVWEMK